MVKLISALVLSLLFAHTALAANIGNDNLDFTLTCDGTPHGKNFPVGQLSINKAAWDLNFGAYNSSGVMGWLVVSRHSDAGYLLFDMSNHWHNQQDWFSPYFNTVANDSFDVTGSCYGAPFAYIKVQLWYLE